MMGLVGIASLILIGYLLSYDRKSINWRTVFGAFSIQVAIALFVLYVPSGVDILLKVTDFIQGVMGYAKLGADFLFGKLGDGSLGFVFALNVLPGIVFFSALIAVLYYLGIMRWMIHLIGGALHKALGTSKPESMSAAANIFVGQNEAPLVVSPFVRTMTQSELFAIMVGGFASIAGSTMAGYAAIGIELKYLIAGRFYGGARWLDDGQTALP
jgi:CNT family concentrative nucleoside transporter